MVGKEPLVTIYCVTYNHREYIEDAFRGFLNQKTDFPFEVVIYDDASTDGTSEIIREYCEKYPDTFRARINEVNMYTSPNRTDRAEDNYKNLMRGKYIAYCEGDDYWTDDQKLQIQVSYMEKNHEVVITGHSSQRYDLATKKLTEYCPFDGDTDIQIKDILNPRLGVPSTASIVVKRDCMVRKLAKNTPIFIRGGGDISQMLYALSEGKFHYFSRSMSVYREHVPNGWTTRMFKDYTYSIRQHYRAMLFFAQYDEYTNHEYGDLIRKRLNGVAMYNALICEKMDKKEFEEILINLPEESSLDGMFKETLRKVFLVFRDGEGLYEEEKMLIASKNKCVIFGTGDYSNCVTRILNHNGENIDGYIIGRGRSGFQEGKPVWHVKEYPFEKEETVVVAGVGPYLRDEIMNVLLDTGFTNVVGPLWHDFLPEYKL